MPFPSLKQAIVEEDAENGIGAQLAAVRRRSSLYDVRFRQNTERRSICRFRMSIGEMREFVRAIASDSMYVDPPCGNGNERGIFGDFR